MAQGETMGPVDHIARSILPWRPEESTLTECGLPAASYPTLSRRDFFWRLKDLGIRRSAMVTCITCAETASRWETWDEDPVHAMKRETAKYWRSQYLSGHSSNRDKYRAFRSELRAIASLIAAHSDEFARLVEAHQQTPTLAERRRSRESP